MDEANHCVLVVIGEIKDGKKALLAIQDGYRESKQSWKELLLDLKKRGLSIDPKLAVGDRIRTTNPIELAFATVSHRTVKTRGCVSRESMLSITAQESAGDG